MKNLKKLMLAMSVVSVISCSTEASYKVNSELTSPYTTAAQTRIINDKALEKRLNSVLSNQIKPSDLKVVVNFNNVLLVGQVANQADSLNAENIVKKWPGTNLVFNYLTINPQPSSVFSSSISSQSMQKIKDNFDLNPDNIAITTADGVVYIMGTNVGNLTALNTVVDGIYSISGVRKVVNLEQKSDLDYLVN